MKVGLRPAWLFDTIPVMAGEPGSVVVAPRSRWRRLASGFGGVVAFMMVLAAAGAIPDRVRVIDRTRDWPAPPFAVARGVAGRERAALIAALLTVPGGAVAGLVRTVGVSRRDYEGMLSHAR